MHRYSNNYKGVEFKSQLVVHGWLYSVQHWSMVH